MFMCPVIFRGKFDNLPILLEQYRLIVYLNVAQTLSPLLHSEMRTVSWKRYSYNIFYYIILIYTIKFKGIVRNEG